MLNVLFTIKQFVDTKHFSSYYVKILVTDGCLTWSHFYLCNKYANLYLDMYHLNIYMKKLFHQQQLHIESHWPRCWWLHLLHHMSLVESYRLQCGYQDQPTDSWFCPESRHCSPENPCQFIIKWIIFLWKKHKKLKKMIKVLFCS